MRAGYKTSKDNEEGILVKRKKDKKIRGGDTNPLVFSKTKSKGYKTQRLSFFYFAFSSFLLYLFSICYPNFPLVEAIKKAA